jgi:hypothetical protein
MAQQEPNWLKQTHVLPPGTGEILEKLSPVNTSKASKNPLQKSNMPFITSASNSRGTNKPMGGRRKKTQRKRKHLKRKNTRRKTTRRKTHRK